VNESLEQIANGDGGLSSLVGQHFAMADDPPPPTEGGKVFHFYGRPLVPSSPVQGAGVRLGSQGMARAIPPANENLSAAGIRSQKEQYAWQVRKYGLGEEYLKNFSPRQDPESLLRSYRVWEDSKTLSDLTGIPRHETFAIIVNSVWQRMGANRWITPDQAKLFMSKAAGTDPYVVPPSGGEK
jgi:hypothetical protein